MNNCEVRRKILGAKVQSLKQALNRLNLSGHVLSIPTNDCPVVRCCPRQVVVRKWYEMISR